MGVYWATILEQGLGVVLAVAASVATLSFFHWVLSPKVEFSRFVHRRYSSFYGHPLYNLKVRTRGFFHLIDTRVVARIFVQDLQRDGSASWTNYTIPTSFSNPLTFKKNRRLIRLKLDEFEALGSDGNTYLKLHTVINRPEIGARFEDIFLSYPGAYLLIQLMGHNSFTGVKKVYSSKRYTLHTFVSGKWNGMEIEVSFPDDPFEETSQ